VQHVCAPLPETQICFGLEVGTIPQYLPWEGLGTDVHLSTLLVGPFYVGPLAKVLTAPRPPPPFCRFRVNHWLAPLHNPFMKVPWQKG
jgi:hypothetical protein